MDMPSVNPPWWLEVPIHILRGLEASLTVPPEGQKLLAKLGASTRASAPEVGEYQEFVDAMTGADNTPDRRWGLVERMTPHLAVLSGEAGQDTEFARWVLAQTPWVFTLKDDDFRHFARWPRLQGLSIHQSHISGKAFENLAAALPDFRRLKLINNRPKAPFWESLPSLQRLEALVISEKKLGDEYVDVLLSLPRLRELDLPGKALTPAGLGRLAAHPALESLRVSPVDDDALLALAGAKSLRRILTYRPTVTDEGLRRLAGMRTRVCELHLSTASKVTDEGAAALATMGQLTHVHISSAKITNKGVEELAKLKGLIELDIGSCSKVNDKAAPVLAGMKGLKMLRITGTKISPEGLAVIGKGLGSGCNLVTRG